MPTGAVQHYDVAVVGAGPAGCAAARTLAQQGVKVVLLEKATLPRYKTCGGGLLSRAFRLLPAGVGEVVERAFHSVEFNVAGQGLRFVATREVPLVCMTMRADLDLALAREAERSGARLVTACPVRQLVLQGDLVELQAEGLVLQASFLIVADGAGGPLARWAGWPPIPCLAPALECEVQLDEPDFRRLSSTARFDFNIPPHGYAWVFPKRDHLSIGVLDTRRGATNLNAALEDYLRALGLSRVRKMERHGWLIPLAPRPRPLARGRVLLVGDAAGLVDPVTTEGISHALLSGQLAAQAIVEGARHPARVCSRYDALLSDPILAELRAARFLAHCLYQWPRLRDWVLRRNGQGLAEFMADVVLGRKNYHEALRRPASYFKALGFWTRRGN